MKKVVIAISLLVVLVSSAYLKGEQSKDRISVIAREKLKVANQEEEEKAHTVRNSLYSRYFEIQRVYRQKEQIMLKRDYVLKSRIREIRVAESKADMYRFSATPGGFRQENLIMYKK